MTQGSNIKRSNKNICNENDVVENESKDEIYLEERILIPDDDYEGCFNFRKFWLFTGPGWLSRLFQNVRLKRDFLKSSFYICLVMKL